MKKQFNYNNITKNENRIIGLIQSKSNINEGEKLIKKAKKLATSSNIILGENIDLIK